MSGNNVNLKKYYSKGRNNIKLISGFFLPNCFSEMSFREKKQKKIKVKKESKKILRQEIVANFLTNKEYYNNYDNNKNKSIDLEKKFNKTMNKLPKKTKLI